MGELCWLRRGAEQLGVFTTAPYFNANHRSQAEQIQAMVSGGADLALVFASEDSGHADEARRIAVEAGIPEILHVAPAREGVYPMAIRAECCPGRGCTTDLFLTKATDDSGSPAYVYRRQSNGDEYGPAAEVAPS